jgi:TonB family protein
VERIDTRQGFLISALAHLGIIMLVASRPVTAPKSESQKPEEAPRVAQRVFLPPPSVLRQVVPIPPPATAAPRPAPPAPTPAPQTKDRMSIGPPVDARQKGPLILRREDDLTQVPKGRPDAVPEAATPPPPAVTPPDPARAAGVDRTGTPGLRLPPGLGQDLPRGTEGSPGKPGESRPSIANSLRTLDQRLRTSGPIGLESGTGRQMGPLFFDPQGADFTAWVNHFKNEVYRNWIVPQPALMGFRGHVDLEMTVERDGSLSNVRILKSTGTQALDRAAQNALVGSRFLPLPSDFAPERVTIQVTFFYNEAPAGS